MLRILKDRATINLSDQNIKYKLEVHAFSRTATPPVSFFNEKAIQIRKNVFQLRNEDSKSFLKNSIHFDIWRAPHNNEAIEEWLCIRFPTQKRNVISYNFHSLRTEGRFVIPKVMVRVEYHGMKFKEWIDFTNQPDNLELAVCETGIILFIKGA